jgi:hypothetical protein
LLPREPIVLLGGAWFLALPLPLLLPDLYSDRLFYELSQDVLDAAALWMLRGFAAAQIWYWLVRVCTRAPSTAVIERGDIEGRYRIFIGMCATIGAVADFVYLRGSIYQFIPQGYVPDDSFRQILLVLANWKYSYVALYVATPRRERKTKENVIAVVLLATQAFYIMGSGSKYTAAGLIGAAVLGAAWRTGDARRPSRALELGRLALAGLAVISAFYFTAAYRGAFVRSAIPPQNATLGDRLAFQSEVAVKAIEDLLSGQPLGFGFYEEYSGWHALDRLAAYTAFALVLEMTNEEPPRENFWESIAAPIWAFIPRALVSEKVAFVDSGRFAKMYGWDYGGLSLTYVGSFYWAWGYTGIVVGMSMMGAGLAWIVSMVGGGRKYRLVWFTVLAEVFVAVLDVGVIFQDVVIGATRRAVASFVAYAAVSAIYARRWDGKVRVGRELGRPEGRSWVRGNVDRRA